MSKLDLGNLDSIIENLKTSEENVTNILEKQSKELEIKDKMIDSMVNEVLALDKIRARYEQDRPRIWETEEGIKEYFRKKVEENG